MLWTNASALLVEILQEKLIDLQILYFQVTITSIHYKVLLLSIQYRYITLEKHFVKKVSDRFENDSISRYFLKLAFPYIKTSLVLLYNTSVESNLSPDKWKIARITSKFLEGDRACTENYWSISVSQWLPGCLRNWCFTSFKTTLTHSNPNFWLWSVLYFLGWDWCEKLTNVGNFQTCLLTLDI